MVEFLITELSAILDSSKIFEFNIVELAMLESSSVELSTVDPVAEEFSKIELVLFESVIFEKVFAQEVRAMLTLIINKTKRNFFIFCSISNDKEKVCEDRFSLPALTKVLQLKKGYNNSSSERIKPYPLEKDLLSIKI